RRERARSRSQRFLEQESDSREQQCGCGDIVRTLTRLRANNDWEAERRHATENAYDPDPSPAAHAPGSKQSQRRPPEIDQRRDDVAPESKHEETVDQLGLVRCIRGQRIRLL